MLIIVRTQKVNIGLGFFFFFIFLFFLIVIPNKTLLTNKLHYF